MLAGLITALLGLVLVAGQLAGEAPRTVASMELAALTTAQATPTRTLDRADASRCDVHRLLVRHGVLPGALPALPARPAAYVVVATRCSIVHHHASPAHIAESRAPPAAHTVS